MTSTRVAAAAIAACTMVLGAPAALARQDEGSVQPTTTSTPGEAGMSAPPEVPAEPQDTPVLVTLAINPPAALPGQAVTVTAACAGMRGSQLSSPALHPVLLTPAPDGHQPWALSGTTSVVPDAAPGEYEVTAECDDDEVSTTLTVLPAGGGADGNEQTQRAPEGASETGGGPEPGLPVLLLATAGLVALGGLGALAARWMLRR